MLSEFKAFIAKGNVMDLAVAVIIGGAFGTIVTSLTGDIIMPIVSAIFGGADFTANFILLSTPAGYQGSMSDYAALKEAGAVMIGWAGSTSMRAHAAASDRGASGSPARAALHRSIWCSTARTYAAARVAAVVVAAAKCATHSAISSLRNAVNAAM